MVKKIISAALFLTALNSGGITLPECGRVVGHEMDLWEFTSANPSPRQVDEVLKSPLKFVKISLQHMKDGNWAVDHSDQTGMTTPSGEIILVNYANMTLDDFQRYKAKGYSFDLYLLADYIKRDHDRLCWMLSPKESPDDSLVQKLIELNAQDRTVILTYGLPDVKFLATYPLSDKLHYAGRVSTSLADLDAYKPYLSNLWAMEIDPTSSTQNMIVAAHNLGLKAYVDSMTYSKTYEIFGTACKKVFDMGVDYTQTNRALQCIREMGFKP